MLLLKFFQVELNLYHVDKSQFLSIAWKNYILKETNLNILKRGIKIFITYDEEIAFSGIKEIIKEHIQIPQYVIVGEPTDNEFITGCKGLSAVRLKTIGKKVHSSRPDKGKSANLQMIKLLNELEEFYEKNVKIEKDNNIFNNIFVFV